MTAFSFLSWASDAVTVGLLGTVEEWYRWTLERYGNPLPNHALRNARLVVVGCLESRVPS